VLLHVTIHALALINHGPFSLNEKAHDEYQLLISTCDRGVRGVVAFSAHLFCMDAALLSKHGKLKQAMPA
jgi:hypothetical protein